MRNRIGVGHAKLRVVAPPSHDAALLRVRLTHRIKYGNAFSRSLLSSVALSDLFLLFLAGDEW